MTSNWSAWAGCKTRGGAAGLPAGAVNSGPVRHRASTEPSGFAAGSRLAFTLVELLVVLSVLLILASIFIPYARQVRESDRRVRCYDNLQRIFQGLSHYAATNHGAYPCTWGDGRAGYTCYTGADAGEISTNRSGVAANDVTASLWLLVRLELATPRDFICPSTDDLPDANTGGRANFGGPANLSYSYACPFSRSPRYRLNDTRASGFALLADRNPGISSDGDVTGPASDAPPMAMSAANSANHRQAGQSVLYADGSVAFSATPYCGTRRDNIYTALDRLPRAATDRVDGRGTLGRGVGPAWESDSYLVPTMQDDVLWQPPATRPVPGTTTPATHANR